MQHWVMVIVSMRNKLLKKYIYILLALIISVCGFSYAKVNPFEEQVEEPTAENRINFSDEVIVSSNLYNEYNPINPIKPGVNIDEYNMVDNYIIDLKTLDYRIKYFSPSYLNIRNSAESMYWVSYYARGGNDTLVYDSNSYTEEVLSAAKLYKNARNTCIKQRNSLDKNDPTYNVKYNILTNQINNYNGLYNATYSIVKTVSKTKSALGLSRTLYSIGNIDNNSKISYARRMVTQNLTSVVMTCLQLNTYAEILEKQSKLYYDIYQLTKRNFELGLATSYDVSKALDDYEDSKSDFKSTSNTLKDVKEQIAINLGYDVKDVDNLVFVEPDVDLELINSVNFEEDKTRAYTSNSAYYSLKIDDKDRRLPQSTGEEILKKRQDYYSNKVIAEFENLYNNLLSKKVAYESSMYLEEICNINDESNKRKFDNNLVSEIEYKGLELQNLGNKLQVKIAKYDLINAYNSYYYGALGNINIS